LKSLINEVSTQLTTRAFKLATAESCTGGGVAYQLTEQPGSSAWFERGFVTYSNLAKVEMLGVKQSLLETFGAVSEPVVRAMAEGALTHSQAQISIAITGIAGPDGGSQDKPVGTVWFGWASIDAQTQTAVQLFSGDRSEVRSQSIRFALENLLVMLNT
jgi:nicotinamide-nucleotide amidase